ncbi:MAG: Wzz/FepE/Etk N-terminal domain-containing protein [Bacteroidota bacterium]|nr:Wzz/FepE/Etk N-terminal domain-containing protein [Bacteroidota bacterium]
MQNLDDKIELKDVLIKFSEYKNYILSNKKSILIGIAIFVLLGLLIPALSSDNYKAKLTFVVEAPSSNLLSSYSGISSQLGIDLSLGESTTFTQENIIEIMKSRAVIEASLMQKQIIDNSNNCLADHYLKINSKDWKDDKRDHDFSFSAGLVSLQHNSIISEICNEISKDYLTIEFESKDANIITLTCISISEEFAKIFVETLIQETEKLYTSITSSKARQTVEYVQERADSVFIELQRAEKEYARIRDINARIVKESGRLKELQFMRDVEVLNTIYLELTKNIEISKINLLNKTPIIQVIDKPKFPLTQNSISLLNSIYVSIFLGFFFSVFRLIFLKTIKDTLD